MKEKIGNMNVDDYMDCDLYEITDIDGEKTIHIFGYYYTNGDDNGGGEYRRVDYSGFYIPLKDYVNWTLDDYDSEQEILKQYIGDMYEYEVEMELTQYLKDATCLPYKELTMDTPNGYYIDNGSWWK